MSGQAIAVLITGLSHVGAAVILVVMLIRFGGARPQDLRDWSDGDDGPGGGPDLRPTGGPGGGGIPLPDADSSAVRLRGPGSIAPTFSTPRRSPHRRPTPQRDSEPAS
jgi:hypothetical protein